MAYGLAPPGSPIPLGRSTMFFEVTFAGPNGGTISSGVENSQAVPLPAAGCLTALAIMVVIVPLVGFPVDATLRLNGVDIVGAALTFTVADAPGTVKIAQFSEPVALGDLINMRYSDPGTNATFAAMAYFC